MHARTLGTIFYNPKLFAENGWQPLTVDSSYDDLVALSDQTTGLRQTATTPPWSMGSRRKWAAPRAVWARPSRSRASTSPLPAGGW